MVEVKEWYNNDSQKMLKWVTFFFQKLTELASFWPRNCQNGSGKFVEPESDKMIQFLGPETCRKCLFLGPEIVKLRQENFGRQKLTAVSGARNRLLWVSGTLCLTAPAT